MSRDIIELGQTIRKRQTAATMKRLEPEIGAIRKEYEGKIANLERRNEELTGCLVAEQEENAALQKEVADLRAELKAVKSAPPAEAAPPQKKGRRR